jgi:transposase InsO family protein
MVDEQKHADVFSDRYVESGDDSRSAPARGCPLHSDCGLQYASREHRKRLDQQVLICSMSRRGNCWDNAMAESFFATLQKELVHHKRYATQEQARRSIFEYIVIDCNRWRSHSIIDY